MTWTWILSARNEETYIKRCLLSLLSQNYPWFEIIMIDDASADNTLGIARSIKDKRLKVIEIKNTPDGWRGKSWASNVGYLESKGDILLFTDADSFFYNKFPIAKTISLMQEKRIQVVTGMPLIELRDFYSKMAIPLINLFSVFRTPNRAIKGHRRKVEYLIGGFFAVNKNVLELEASAQSKHQYKRILF